MFAWSNPSFPESFSSLIVEVVMSFRARFSYVCLVESFISGVHLFLIWRGGYVVSRKVRGGCFVLLIKKQVFLFIFGRNRESGSPSPPYFGEVVSCYSSKRKLLFTCPARA